MIIFGETRNKIFTDLINKYLCKITLKDIEYTMTYEKIYKIFKVYFTNSKNKTIILEHKNLNELLNMLEKE